MSDKPAKKFRIGAVSAAMRKNVNYGATLSNVTLARTYRKDERLKELIPSIAAIC